MAKIPALLMVEPAARRRRAAAVVSGKESPLDLESIKTELGEMRRHCRGNQTSLMEEYQKNLDQSAGVEWTFATNSAQAAAYVKRIAEGTDLVSINKSNVVVNELRSQLEAAGLKTYVRIFNELDRLEKQVRGTWNTPRLHTKGLVESFDVTATLADLHSDETRDYVAVLGVNAVAAADGSVFFLQHMSNISKDLRQARKIVLVVTPEKVVPDRAAALLQTRAMGVYGLEYALLDMGPSEEEKYDFEGLPTISANRSVHVVILDNGRSDLFASQYRDLALCINCRACARQCPITKQMAAQRMVFSPKSYLMGVLQGLVDVAEDCLQCGRCQGECPVDIDIPALWRAWLDHDARRERSR